MQHYFLPWRRATSLVTAAAVLVSQFAGIPLAEASPLGSSTASAGSAPPPSVSAIQSFQPDLFTGRATTSVPFAVPPGRKGMQPALGLIYSSSARNGWVGVGWSLDLGYIERSTKNGTPKYDSSDTYTFLMQGVASELVRIPGGTYRAKDEGLFLRVEQLGVNGWEIRDKSGTRYLFGGAVGTEETTLSGTFRWCLRKIVDTNGNFLTVTYAADQGQLYPLRIDYTGHETNGLKDADPVNRVEFITESRTDVDLSLRSGAEVRTALRLKEVAVYAQGLLARKYLLTYRQSAQTQRSLLERVTQLGTDGVTALPATSFSYQDTAAPAYTLTANNPSVSRTAWNVRQAGFDRGHENFGCVPPNIAEAWSDPTVVDNSANLGAVNASVSGDGNITISFSQDVLIHAWTWVYSAAPRTLNLSYNGAEACLYREDASGLQNFVNGGSIPVQAGWSVLHLTGYHQHSGWTNTLTGSVKPQVTLMSPSQFIKPQLAGDADGNGITDLITFEAATGTWSVSQAMSADFHAPTTWRTGFGSTSTTPLLGDWNGDGRTDIGTFASGAWQFATSTGTAFQTGTVTSYTGPNGSPLTGDFNGDGLIDLGTYAPAGGAGLWKVALGNGSSFVSTPSFDVDLGDSNYDPLTGDFNGDGLTDIGAVHKTTGDVYAAHSTGTGFRNAVPTLIRAGFGPGQPHTTADFNGDGLTDLAFYDKTTGQVRYAPSIGTAFGAAATLPVAFSLRSADDNIQVGDFNGDGLADPAVFNTITGAAEIARSSGEFVDLLQTTRNGLGGSTSLTYTASTQCENLCPMQGTPKLPFVLPLVTATAVNDGMGHTVETRVHYRQGSYDAPTREFRGFGRVEVRDAEATVSITEFHQDEQKKGRPFRTQVQSADGAVWAKQEQTWVGSEPYPGVHFVKLDRTDSWVYDGDSSSRQTGARFAYDQYGNITRVDSEGEVGVTGDERASTTAFVYNPTAWIIGKPSLVQTLDISGAIVAQRRFRYDGAPDHLTPPTIGNLTAEEEWLNQPTPQWLTTQLAYDASGNVTTVTDALNRTTTNTYDSTGTFLTSIRNTLGHQRTLAYDASLGQVTSSTDANSKKTDTYYDVFGRVTKVVGPNDALSQPSMLYEYDLTTLPSKTTAHSRIQSGQDALLTVYAFADGLGRTIQTRAPAEQAGKQVVSGAAELNARGQVIRQWAPYPETASTQYVPPFTLALAPPVTYEYDAVGRLLRTIAPDGGISSTAYQDWSVTGTDALGHQARRTNDAYGRLAQVEEFESGQTHTTTYAYDTLDNLLRVTDSAGNITTITYDSLGRKLGMDDPDMGHWAYAYDAVDNLTQQTDARGVTIAFVYDSLNRLTGKTYTVPAGSGIQATAPVTYEYELAGQANAIGKLCRITDGSGTSHFEYDALGRLVRESKTIDAATYTIDRQYDLLGRLTALTYPDGESVEYTYNAQGGIETIIGGGLGGGGLVPAGDLSPAVTYVSNIDYNAAGQLIKIAYGNGVVTDYTYNPQTLRLDRLVTDGPGGRLQDFSYGFDAIGNVSQITDAVHTGSQTFEYDSLNRLTRANGAYGDFRYAYNPIGNMLEKEGMQMTYGAGTAGPHAVTSTSAGWTMRYDLNGNMVEKSMEPTPERSALLTQYLGYDAENRLVKVETAQEQTLEVALQPGWNFFSLPVLPENGAVVVLLPNFAQDFEQIAKFDADTGTFSYYVGNPAFDDFTELEYGVGYQVYAKQAVKVSIRGKKPTRGLQKSLASGWHLLPAITHSSAPAANVFAGISRSQTLGLANGSLTAATTTEKGQAYFVQVTAASTWTAPLPENVTTSFVYDGDGGRVKQITAAGTTTFLGQSFEKAPDGKTTKYIFAGSQRITAKDSTGDLRFYHGDHLGSSNTITNGTGQLIELTEYTPYGSISRHEGTADVPQKFTGQRLDASTGLYFYNARYYEFSLGRFISPDSIVQSPTDPQSLNRYSYVRNNPINFVDPTGHSFWKAFKRVYVALVTLGMSETIPATTKAIVSLSEKAGVDPRYGLALYSATIGFMTGGIGAGVAGSFAIGAGVSGGLVSGGTSLAMASGEGRQITQKVAKEFFIDVVGMSPRSAYTAASFTVSIAISIGVQLAGMTADYMRSVAREQSAINPDNIRGRSIGYKGDNVKLAGNRVDKVKTVQSESILGGLQGGPGNLLGIPYESGSLGDMLAETFAGPHDFFSMPLYDAMGNGTHFTGVAKAASLVYSGAALAPATPLAVAGPAYPYSAGSVAFTGLIVDQGKGK